jgi:hypothetical protein
MFNTKFNFIFTLSSCGTAKAVALNVNDGLRNGFIPSHGI